ncbi:MAG: prepilin peptidase [Candidatus Riflebacteria bacterium]|nr:prepilin peptidase [Candidatus Riflebacteria bacterium]
MLDEILAPLAAFADLPLGLQLPFVAMFAGLLGSFVNVCIWRIPRGQSIVFPRSHCPACRATLGVPDLVPVLSYLALRGRCRHCGAPFSSRYMWVEVLLISIWCSALCMFGLSWGFLAAAVAASILVTLTGICLMARSMRRGSGGFTFISIILAMVLLGIVVTPFLEVIRTGYMGATKNREYILAYNLARERLEELRLIPARQLKPDWEVYVKGTRLTDNIFVDEFGPLAKWGQSEKVFYANFSDVMTERTQLPETVQDKFRRNYKRYYGCDYELYSDDHVPFRRVTRVQELTDPSSPGIVLQKVTVTVVINSKITRNRAVEVSAIMSDRGQ